MTGPTRLSRTSTSDPTPRPQPWLVEAHRDIARRSGFDVEEAGW